MPPSDGAYCTDQVFFSLLFCLEPKWQWISWEKHSTDDEAAAHFRTGVLPTSGAIFSLRMSLKHEQVLLRTKKYHFIEGSKRKHTVWRTRYWTETWPHLNPNSSFQRSASQKPSKSVPVCTAGFSPRCSPPCQSEAKFTAEELNHREPT